MSEIGFVYGDKFELKTNVFQSVSQEGFQYYHLYSKRLEALRPLILKNNLPEPYCSSINKCVNGTKSSIIGVVYKNLANRASILQYYSELGFDSSPKEELSISDNDKLFLEDGSKLIELKGSESFSLDPGLYTTGSVLGFYGTSRGSIFIVESVFYPVMNPPPPLPNIVEDCWIYFISELCISSTRNYATGLKNALNGCHLLVLLGNNLEEEDNAVFSSQFIPLEDKLNSRNFSTSLLQSCIKTLGVKNVVLMPGENDPCSIMLPQQPYHSCLINENTTKCNLIRATNPCYFSVHQCIFLCNSGETPTDIQKTTKYSFHESINMLLKWGHISPTCPDHITGLPILEGGSDRLVMDIVPQVFACGLAPEFKVTDENGTIAISVPSFKNSHGIVAFNLRTRVAELKNI